MSRPISYLLGPELSWLFVYVATVGLVALYQPLGTDSAKEQLLNYGWFLPAVGVALAFVPLFWAPGNHWLWLVRIDIASAIGITLLVNYICDSVHYNDSRDSGVGTAYMVFMIVGWLMLIVALLVAVLFLWTKWPFLPVLKRALIGLGVLLAIAGIISWLASFGRHKAT